MNRTIITVESVRDAQRRNETRIHVPCNGIITPAAADMALVCGVVLEREAAAPTTGGKKARAVPCAVPAAGMKTTGSASSRPSHSISEQKGGSVSPDSNEALFAEVKRRVMEQLPEAMRQDSFMDELIGKCIARIVQRRGESSPVRMLPPGTAQSRPAEARQTSFPPLEERFHPAGAPQKSIPAATAGAARGTVAQPGQEKGGQPCPWRNTAGAALRVDSSKLPWKNPAKASDGANIIDAVCSRDGTPFTVGYMEWDAASFSWKAESDKICTVLQGELQAGLSGTTLAGRPGDVLYIPKGSDVTFSSTGYVRFVCVAAVTSAPVSPAVSGAPSPGRVS